MRSVELALLLLLDLCLRGIGEHHSILAASSLGLDPSLAQTSAYFGVQYGG